MVAIENTGLIFQTSDFTLKQGTFTLPSWWQWAKPRKKSVTLAQRYTHKGRHRNDAVNRVNWWRDMSIRFGILAAIINVYFMTALVLKGWDSSYFLFALETALLTGCAGTALMFFWLRYREGKHTAHNLQIEAELEAMLRAEEEVVIGK